MTKKRIIVLATFVGLILGLSLTLLGVNNWKTYNFNERNGYMSYEARWDEASRTHFKVLTTDVYDYNGGETLLRLHKDSIVENVGEDYIYIYSGEPLNPYIKVSRKKVPIYLTKNGMYLIQVKDIKVKLNFVDERVIF